MKVKSRDQQSLNDHIPVKLFVMAEDHFIGREWEREEERKSYCRLSEIGNVRKSFFSDIWSCKSEKDSWALYKIFDLPKNSIS